MKNQKLFTNIVLLSCVIIFSVVVLEACYRFYLFGKDSFSIKKMNSVAEIGVAGVLMTATHPEFIYELKPNLDTYFKLVPLKTNSHGLRDKEYEVKKPVNVFRVAVIGDSFTMPSGVKIEDAYHSLLEEWYNKNLGKLTYEFINFGVGGYNLRQDFAVMKYKAQEYDPDLIIVGFSPFDDFNVAPDRLFKQKYNVLPTVHQFYHLFTIEELKKQFELQKQQIRLKIKQSRVNTYVSESNLMLSEPQRNYLSDIFSNMYALSRERSIPIVVVYLSYTNVNTYMNELEDIVVKNGLYFFKAKLPLEGNNDKKYWIYTIDAHPNAKAHKIYAEQIYEYLNEKKLVIKKQDW